MPVKVKIQEPTRVTVKIRPYQIIALEGMRADVYDPQGYERDIFQFVLDEVGGIDVPTKTSELENDSGFITENDIPEVPTKVSQLQNDAGYITANDIPAGFEPYKITVQKNSTQYSKTYKFFHDGVEVGYYALEAICKDATKYVYVDDIYNHNILPLTSFREGDHMAFTSVAYNYSSVAYMYGFYFDIVEGIREISTKVPKNLSDLSTDATHRTVTDALIANWNAKSDFSGNYDDLSNKPTIPTVPTNVSAFTNDAGYLVPDDIADKMEKHLLQYDGTKITDNGTQLTFDALYTILMESSDFAVLVHNNYAYHPNGVSTEQIVFTASYPVNGLDVNHRITMLKNGTITKTDNTDENVINKTDAITDANKTSTVKYPSLKAVADYVETVLNNLNANEVAY